MSALAPTRGTSGGSGCAEPGTGPTLVLVGGVPGAGKSTLLADIELPPVRTLDPDTYRRLFGRLLPHAPYRSYRLLVHLLHAGATLAALTLGPVAGGPQFLLVHNPATRTGRRDLIGRFAQRCGWRTVLLLMDADREQALAGQHSRGRVINSGSFDRHWDRWIADRDRRAAAAEGQARLDGWDEVQLADRSSAASTLAAIVGTTANP